MKYCINLNWGLDNQKFVAEVDADNIFEVVDSAWHYNVDLFNDNVVFIDEADWEFRFINGYVVETNPWDGQSWVIDSDGTRCPYFGFKSTEELIEEYTDLGAMGKEMDCSPLYFTRLEEEIALRDYYESFRTEPVECAGPAEEFEAFKIETDELPF